MARPKLRAETPVKMGPVGTETLKEMRAAPEPHRLYGRDPRGRYNHRYS